MTVPAFFLLDARNLVLADGAAVASWADSSGNGLTATQATGGAQPTYAATGINGQPAVTFSGAQYLQTAAANLTSLMGGSSGTFTAYVVGVSTNAVGHFISKDDALSNRVFQVKYATNPTLIGFSGSTPIIDSQSGSTGTARQMTFVRTDTTAEVYVDGTSGGATTGGTAQNLFGTSGKLTIGTYESLAEYLTGKISYIALCAGVHGSTTRQAIQSSLKSAFGTP